MKKKRNRYRPDLAKRRRKVMSGVKAVFGCALSLAAVILLSAALAHGYHALIYAPLFRVSPEDVVIVGLKHLKEDEILNTLMIPPDSSLLSLKSVDLAKRLEKLPWLESSLVRFSLPNRIEVIVNEREPLALIHAQDSFLIDTDGKLVSRASAEQKQDFLVVDGFAGLGLKEGDLIPRATLRELKELLGTLSRAESWLPRKAILTCRWSAESGYALYTARNSICIQLGWDRFEEKLHHLHRIFSLMDERQLWNAVIGIDLDYENRAYLEGLFPFPKGT